MERFDPDYPKFNTSCMRCSSRLPRLALARGFMLPFRLLCRLDVLKFCYSSS